MELLRSEWSQFDLQQGTWTKPSAHTKANRVHRLELGEAQVTLLARMRSQDPDGGSYFLAKTRP